nr:S9 family peptidase [Sphingomonadaceae bacterium]
MRKTFAGALLLAAAAAPAHAAFDAPAAFGARQGIEDIALSPDGKQIAFVAPGTGQSSALFVVPADKSSAPRRITGASGNPERLLGCWWVSNARLLCSIYVIQRAAGYVVGATRMVAVDAAGGNIRLVSRRDNTDAFYYSTYGGSLVDLLPGQDGSVLVSRSYVPRESVGSLITHEEQGLGVDRVDTLTLATKPVVPPTRLAYFYISDGVGNVRIMAQATENGDYLGARDKFYYRPASGGGWQVLGTYDEQTHEGFWPQAVDPVENVAYGFQRLDGRDALYKIALNGSMTRALVLARPDVDVDGLIKIGRKQRAVGMSYATDRRHTVYFDPAIAKIAAALGKALPQTSSISIVDASIDENILLIRADSDTDPGRYFLFDRTAKRLEALILSRPELAQTPLATVKSVTVRAADGTMIPAYLTLPPGSSGKGLPAIVMPHGGPSARDEWGFDWLSQFYANRGYAVLQPNFRGSSGYGDSWFQDKGFKSWRVAIGDIVDSGKWLVSQGIADPSKLAIIGWSYGGYAALQSN